MKLAMITARFPPEASPGAKRAGDLSEALRAAGHGVTVLTQMPNYPDPSAFDRKLPAGSRLSIEHDARGRCLWRFSPRVTAKEELARRLLAEAEFAVRVSRSRRRLARLDGVVASSPFVFNLAAASRYRVPAWLDVRDLTWEYARGLAGGSLPRRLAASLLRSVALSSARRARAISTTTETQRRYLIERGLSEKKVVVVPNGVPREVFDRLGRGEGETESTGGPLRIVYAGLLGFPQGLELAVDAVEELGRDGVELHLYGDGVDRPKLEERSRSRGLEHVFVHGHVAYDEYLERIARADVLFASLRPQASSAVPSKIWEYLATGRPVLFAGSGEAAEAVRRAQGGLAVPYGDTRALRDAIRELAKDPDRRQELGRSGRDWVLRHRIREEINREWVERIEEAFGARGGGGAVISPSARSGDGAARHAADGAPRREPGRRAPRLRFRGTASRFLRRGAALALRSGEACGFLRLLEGALARRENRFAVLSYHRILDSAGGREPPASPGLVSASPAAFERQMEELRRRWRVLSMQEVLDAFRNGASLPPRSVLVTFDDAYRDFADVAWPILERYGMPATLFVPTAYPGDPEREFWWDRLHRSLAAAERDRIDTPLGSCALETEAERARTYRHLREGLKTLPHDDAMALVERISTELGDGRPSAPSVLDWKTLRSLARKGVTLGLHTRTHPRLDRLDRERIREEVSGSLHDLEREIGDVLPVFAYPAGGVSDAAIEVLAEEGIELAFTTRGGINDLRSGCDPLLLRRIHVGSRTDRAALRAQLIGLRPPEGLRRVFGG